MSSNKVTEVTEVTPLIPTRDNDNMDSKLIDSYYFQFYY
jgi:hypothetical protein